MRGRADFCAPTALPACLFSQANFFRNSARKGRIYRPLFASIFNRYMGGIRLPASSRMHVSSGKFFPANAVNQLGSVKCPTSELLEVRNHNAKRPNVALISDL